MEPSGVLSTTQFAYRKDLGTCDVLFCMCHTRQSSLERQEARIVQIGFSAAFDNVNHQTILYLHCSEGIIGSVLSVLMVVVGPLSDHGCRTTIRPWLLDHHPTMVVGLPCLSV